MNKQEQKIQDFINEYYTENLNRGNKISDKKVRMFIKSLEELEKKGGMATKADIKKVLSTTPGDKLFVLYRLFDIFRISKKVYSEVAMEVYFEHENCVPVDFRVIFSSDRFNGEKGMSNTDLYLFNTLSDMIVCKPLNGEICADLTWVKDPTTYCGCGQCYCTVLEAEVLKKDILFCRQGTYGIEVVVQWANVKVTRNFEVN